MTDLDIQIDVPDDDGLGNPVRSVSQSWLPAWVKPVLFILGVLALLMIVAFILGRLRAQGAEPAATAPSTTAPPISSAADTPAIVRSLEAVQAWETYAQSGDLSALETFFDPAGPQYALFQANQGAGVSPGVTFSAANVSETVSSAGLTTVSMDLVVDGPQGQETFPYDLVFRTGSDRVWTVVDRRSAGAVALPPSQPIVDAASRNWATFVSALGIDDGTSAASVVSAQTRTLADQVASAVAGREPVGALAVDQATFDRLVAQAKLTASTSPLLDLLGPDQRRALVAGRLTTWTQVAEDRVVASLIVDGAPVTVVPFVQSDEGWVFDLIGALEASDGGGQ